MSEIKFRISSVSSEHAHYPAANLTTGQDGWQSAIDAAFPQAITIQFYVPIRTRKLNILFHQYKIPKMLEVFIKLGGKEKYRKLGLVYPNDNSQSGFEEKEEKTLYFEFACTHIRFVLHENYKNERNIFNQVAIDDLIVFGEIMTSRQLDGVNLEDSSDDEVTESVEVSHNARTFQTRRSPVKDEEGVEPSPLFRPIYQKLQQQKQNAAARQDYQKAAHFKKVLTSFKQLQLDISRLQREKQEALSMQDYDRCHRIKFQIAKKKEVVEFQREELFKNQEQFYSQNSFLIVEREATSFNNDSKREQSPIKMAQFKSPEPERRPKNASSLRYDQQVVPALLNKNKSSENLPLQTNQKRKYPLQINQSIIPEGPLQTDNTSIKKDLNQLKQLQNPNEVSISADPRSFQLLPLQNKLRMRIQTYFSFIPERVWQLCESKNWRAKQQALRFIRQRLADIQTKQEFMGTIQLLSRVIMSKHTAITLQVINLINKLADIKIKFTLQHMPFFVEDILNELLNFLNDTNKQTKELAYTTYLKLPEISFLGLSIIAKGLIKHKNNVKNEPKLIITKLQLMSALLQRYSQQEFSHKETISWILGYFQDPNQKVKSQASDLLVTLTYLIGNDKVIRIIENSRPHMMESVLNMMNSSVDYSKIQHEQSKLSLENSKLQHQFYGHEANPSIKANIPQQKKLEKPIYVLQSSQKLPKMQQSKSSRNNDNNVDLSYSKESIYQESLQHPPNAPQEEQEQPQDKHCQYCNQSFDEIKWHYLTQCKLLANCQKCGGFIYIREFTDHLLNNCEESHMFTACRKCGLAFELEESNQHIGRDLCRQKKGVNWERCQFCAEDVLAEDKFWLKHAKECRSLPPRLPPVLNQEDDQ